jgi:hypothetical protein
MTLPHGTTRTRRSLKPLSVTWPAIIVIVAAFALPTAVYLNRFLVPDYSFDTLNYHLFNGWRGWTTLGGSFLSAEFYPLADGNLPPFLDAVFVPVRLFFGYRLGTLPGLVAYWFGIAAAIGIARHIAPAARDRFTALHALIILYAVANLEMLFQLATYFVDILSMALMLAAMYFLLRLHAAVTQGSHWRRWLLASALCAGLALWGKLPELAFCVPVAATLGWVLLVSARHQSIRLTTRITWLAVAAALMVGPAAACAIGNMAATGDPIFPLANAFFHSRYMPAVDTSDPTVGGATLLQRFLFPLFSAMQPGQLAEPNSMFTDFQLTVTWLGALLLGVIYAVRRRRPSPAVAIALFNYLAGILLWSLLFGVERYASFGLVLGGVLLIPLVQELRDLLRPLAPSFDIATVAACAMLFAVANVIQFNLQYDMSWRPTLVHDTSEYLQQLPYLFYTSMPLPLSSAQTAKINVVVNCSVVSSGYSVLTVLRNKPMIDIIQWPNYTPLVDDPVYQQAVTLRLETLIPGQTTLRFAAFATQQGLNPTEGLCITALKQFGASNITVKLIPDFLGYPGQTVDLIVGEIPR